MCVWELHTVLNNHSYACAMKSQETRKCLKLICQLRITRWWSDKNHTTVIWHSFVSFTIPQWIESCNRHFVRTLVASPTMAFERQTAVRAAGRSSTAVKVVVLFELRQPKFSIMSVSLQRKETFVSQPCAFPARLRLILFLLKSLNLLFLFFLSLFLQQSLSVSNLVSVSLYYSKAATNDYSSYQFICPSFSSINLLVDRSV